MPIARSAARSAGKFAGHKAPATPPGDWQLSAGHYETAKIALEIIAPQEGLTTGSSARSYYYRCYPGIQWRVPIAVLGGAWPFRYELLSGPSGMTLGEVYGDTDYGVLNWDNPSAGSYEISVRVTDQESTQDTHTWTLTVTTSNTMFLDAVNGDNSTGSGTLASPYKDFYAWAGSGAGSRNDATYANYHIYYRAGTYDTVNDTDPEWTNDWMPMRQKPFVHIAYPGETATFRINTVTGRFAFIDGAGLGSVDDMFMRGLHWTGVNENSGDAQYMQWSNVSRVTIFENVFDEVTSPGQTGTNAAFALSVREGSPGDAGSLSSKEFTVWHSNTLEQLNSCLMWETYDTQKALIENNVVSAAITEAADECRLVYEKENTRYVTIRNNRATVAGECELSQCGSSAGEYSNIEVCWNLWRVPSGIHHIQTGIETSTEIGPNWIYRNTLIGGDVYHQSTAGGDLDYKNNVRQYQNGTDGVSGTASFTVTGLNTDLVATSGLVDSAGDLESAYSAYVGTHGHKVA